MTDSGDIAQGWPDGRGYLLNHSAGLPPLNAAEALTQGLFGPWVGSDDQVWTHWMKAFHRFRKALAQVINHQPEMICPQASVSAALSQILSSVSAKPGRRKLLIAERAFPSLGFVLSVAQRQGFELVIIPRTENTLDPEVWSRYLTDSVHCAVFTHVHSNTSECHDMPTLCALARENGVISVVDVAQSIGIRAINAVNWDADFIIGSCLKWLCGGPGAGFMWVHPQRLARCEPLQVGWFSHSNPFEFDIRHFEYAGDALRFWGGTPSVAPALTAAHSIESLLAIGLGRLEHHNQILIDKVCNEIDPQWLSSPLEASQRGGTLVLNLDASQHQFSQALRNAGLQFDVRDEGIRLSPHFYNSTDDMALILDCLAIR